MMENYWHNSRWKGYKGQTKITHTKIINYIGNCWELLLTNTNGMPLHSNVRDEAIWAWDTIRDSSPKTVRSCIVWHLFIHLVIIRIYKVPILYMLLINCCKASEVQIPATHLPQTGPGMCGLSADQQRLCIWFEWIWRKFTKFQLKICAIYDN